MNLGPVAKALVGAVAAGVAPYTAARLPGSQDGVGVSLGEWLTVAVAILVASRLVWAADNLRWFKYAKATAAALVVFLGVVSVALLSGETATVDLVLSALFKTALAFGLVSQVPNADRSEWHDPIGGDDEPEPFDPSLYPETFDEHVENGITYDGQGRPLDPQPEPVDADGDGHNDANGQWMPGPRGAAYLSLPPHRILGHLA